MTSRDTRYGFIWGPVDVNRFFSNEKKGWVVMSVSTKKHPLAGGNDIQIYVTKTGKVRIFSKAGEWKPTAKKGIIK